MAEKILFIGIWSARCERTFEVGRQSRVGVLEITKNMPHTQIKVLFFYSLSAKETKYVRGTEGP